MRRIAIALMMLLAAAGSTLLATDCLGAMATNISDVNAADKAAWNAKPQIIVAASNTNATAALTASYVCDGTADQVQIQAAVDAAESAGGLEVFLLPGDYNLVNADSNGCVHLKDGVSIQGVKPQLVCTANCADLAFRTNGHGTVLWGTIGNEIIFWANTNAAPASDDVLSSVDISNLGFKNCTQAIKIGARNHNGLAFSSIRDVYVDKTNAVGSPLTDTNDAIEIINPQHIVIERIGIYFCKKGLQVSGYHQNCANGCLSIRDVQVTLGESPSYGIKIAALGGSGYQTFDGINMGYVQVNHINGGNLPAHYVINGTSSTCKVNRSFFGPLNGDGPSGVTATVDINYCNEISVICGSMAPIDDVKIWNTSYSSFYACSTACTFVFDQNATNTYCLVSGIWGKPSAGYDSGSSPLGTYLWYAAGGEVTLQNNLYSTGSFNETISSNRPGKVQRRTVRYVPAFRDCTGQSTSYNLSFSYDEGAKVSFITTSNTVYLPALGSSNTYRGYPYTISNEGANDFNVMPSANEYIDGVQNAVITVKQYQLLEVKGNGYNRWSSVVLPP